MRKSLMLLSLLLFVAGPVLAAFCVTCGQKLPDAARFCSSCGTKISVPAPGKAAPPAQKAPARRKPLKAGKKTYTTKTDLYLYARKNDANNILKKNFLFKPRRYKLQNDRTFKILDRQEDAYLLETTPDKDGKTATGWVHESELKLRSDWEGN